MVRVRLRLPNINPLKLEFQGVFNSQSNDNTKPKKFTHAQTQYHLQNFKSLPLDIIKNCLAECSDD